MKNPCFAVVVTSVTSLPVNSLEKSPKCGTGSSVINVTNGLEPLRQGFQLLVALTQNESACLLNPAMGLNGDNRSAQAVPGHLFAPADRAQLHTNRKEADL
jgi:hypothetical protein